MKPLFACVFLQTKLSACAHAAAIAGRRGFDRDLAALRDQVEQQQVEIELLRARLSRLESVRRPRYQPHERLRILLYRARWPASLAEMARRFVLSVDTVREWTTEVDAGVARRVKTAEPVN